ncbi:hypothetical protein ACHAXA_010904 [Cyclostephanos tholiformis]|uniref:Transmembrane protein n=1 Tax=Cyclostephanos tholiformis TaxID=382380 RepID=A0ABD3R7E3_9STRA
MTSDKKENKKMTSSSSPTFANHRPSLAFSTATRHHVSVMHATTATYRPGTMAVADAPPSLATTTTTMESLSSFLSPWSHSSLGSFLPPSTVVVDGDHATTMASAVSTGLTSSASTTMLSLTTRSTSSMLSSTGSVVFEAVAPNPAVLAAMGSVVLLCVAAGYVWANDVVPVSRTKLAISKSRGEVREYLDGLRPVDDAIDAIVDDSTYPTTNATSDIDPSSGPSTIRSSGDEVTSNIKPNVGDGREFERWLFTDWLNKPNNGKGGRQKEPALPILKDAKWNSGDNPVLVTAAIMMLGVILASITERIAT